FSRSTSPQTTSWPSRAKQAAVVSPTYPPPTTAIALMTAVPGSALRRVGRWGRGLPLPCRRRARRRRGGCRRRGRGRVGSRRVGRRRHGLEVLTQDDGDVGLDDRLVLDEPADTAQIALDDPRLVQRAGAIVDLGRAHAGLVPH